MDRQEKERLLSEFAAALSDELASSASDSNDAGPSKKHRTSPAPHGVKDSAQGDSGPRTETSLKFQPPSRIRRAGQGASEGAYNEGPVPLLAPTDPDTSFAALEVQPWLVRSLANMAIKQPTAVQKACIPEILKGRDCIGGSKTGSGKTAAFVVPILQMFYKNPCGIFALVLTATRELAMQIADSFTAFAAPFNLRLALVTGGRDMVQQAIDLSKVPHIVIATPGRLADHIQCSGEDTVGGLKRVRFVVLDEADRLLAREVSGSMVPDVEECLRAVPEPSRRQTLLFTATMTPDVRNFKDLSPRPGKQPAFVCDVDPLVIPSSLHQTYIQVPVTHKEHYLHVFLLTEGNKDKTVILFCNRTSTVEYLHHLLYLLDHKVTSLHSKLRQQERTDNLGRFRASAARILVATDVAARGLDIPQVSMVLNYDLPRDPDDYIHRVGRAARAGRKGEAATFVTRKRDVNLVHAVEERVDRQLVAWEEEGVNLETRVLRDALKLVSEKKIEARLELEEDRKIGGQRRRGKRKLRAE